MSSGSWQGGGIYSDSGSVTISGVNAFEGNSAGIISYPNGSGGAIYIDDTGSLTITGSNSFFYNQADQNGGAIYFAGTTCSISGSAFAGNNNGGYTVSGDGDGGAIYSTDQLTVSGCTFTENSDYANGGAIYCSASLTLTGENTFTDNTASKNGGAIYGSGSVTISGTNTFEGSNAAQNGGAIYCTNVLSVSGSSFSDNSSDTSTSGDGGAIYSTDSANVANSSFTNSQSYQYGGAIYNSGVLSIADSTFTGNGGVNNGGAIYNSSGSSLVITDSSFVDNSNDTLLNNGGGGAIYNAGILSVSNSTFNGNDLANYGGAIFSNNALTVDDSTFFNNSVTVNGGAIYSASSGTISISNSTISGNSAPDGIGGGIRIGTGTVSLLSTIVAGNTNGTSADDISGNLNVAESAYNLIGTGGAGGLTNNINGNQVGVSNAGLAALGNYGGPTQTIALLPGSPALTKGTNFLTTTTQNITAGQTTSTFTVSDPTFLGAGMVILIGSEQMTITNVTTNTVTVTRSGSGPGYSSGASVYLPIDQRGFTRTVGASTDVGAFEQSVPNAPILLTDPISQTVNAGQNLSFTASASGNPTPAIEWQVNTGSGFVTISNGGVYSGATSGTLTITGATNGMNGYQYQALFINNDGTSTTNPATLTVNAFTYTTVTANPVGALTTGESVTFTAFITHNPSVGTVSFYVGSVSPSNQIGSAVAVSGGMATSAADISLPVGPNTIIAVYSGGVDFQSSQGMVTVTVYSVTPAPAIVGVTVNGSGFTSIRALEDPTGTTATITGAGLNSAGFYAGELVNISGFTNQTGFNGTYNILAISGSNSFTYLDSAAPATDSDVNVNASVYPAVEETNAGIFHTTEASMVNSLVVVFNEAVTIAPSFTASTAFGLSLKAFTDDSVTGSLVGDATTTITASNPSGDGVTWVLTFSGGTVVPVVTGPYGGGSISDGDYYLNLAAGAFTSAYTPTTTNAASYQQNSFHRLFGDDLGSGFITNPNYNQFKLAYGSLSPSAANYNAAFDFNASGFITNNQSYNQFKLRYGTIWSGL